LTITVSIDYNFSINKQNDFFAVCSPGLENILLKEISDLPQANKITAIPGGVEFEGDFTTLYNANLRLRTATRILVRIGSFKCVGFPELIRKAERLPWENYLHKGKPVSFRTTCKNSKLYHSDAVSERIAKAVTVRLGAEPIVTKYDEENDNNRSQLIVVRLVKNECTISIDSSGEPLYKRGYRLAVAKAPLRETLAAGIILASGWDGSSPLMDPFCGSGTIPIEAALIASNRSPGLDRSFSFENWPDFDISVCQEARSIAEKQITGSSAVIIGSDRDAGAVDSAASNAGRANASTMVELKKCAVSDIKPVGSSGWIVTNPPYGERIKGRKDLRDLYAKFGTILRERFSGWHVSILCNDEILIKNTGLKFSKAGSLKLINGGLKVSLSSTVIS
jgi:putative N6-adenine-specific DNA methylase